MPPNQIGPLRRAWYNWKALRLPWRKRFLVGMDLQGNTFWEFRDIRTDDPGRWRRMAKYPGRTHFADVKFSPQWHQWLRHMRKDPPSLVEQRQELERQERMKLLAAQADARWASKPSMMDTSTDPAAIEAGVRSEVTEAQAEAAETTTDTPADQSFQTLPHPEESPTPSQSTYDPWKQARGGPSEDWQPESWDPSKAKLR